MLVRGTGLRSYPRLYFEMIAVGFTAIMGMSLGTSFLPILALDLDPSGALVGLVVAAWFLSRVFIELPAGIISDRIGRRKLLIAGVGLSSMGAFLCARADSIYLLILGRAVWGLGTALYFMCNTALIIDITDAKSRGQAMGTFNGIEFIGSFVGTPIGAFLAGYVGYSNVYYFTLVLTLNSLIVAVTSKSLKAAGGGKEERRDHSVRQSLIGLRSIGVVVICMCSFFRMLLMQGIFSTVFELHLKEELLFSLTEIGFAMSLRTGGHIVATISSGYLSNRFGRRNVVMAGFVIDAACLLSLTVMSTLPPLLVVGFVEGIGEGLVFTSLMVLLSDIVHPSVRGGAIGLFRTFQDIGGFLGPIVFMAVYSSFDSRAAFLLAVCVNVLNISLLVLTRRTRGKEESHEE